jgi:hypothetical protein
LAAWGLGPLFCILSSLIFGWISWGLCGTLLWSGSAMDGYVLFYALLGWWLRWDKWDLGFIIV